MWELWTTDNEEQPDPHADPTDGVFVWETVDQHDVTKLSVGAVEIHVALWQGVWLPVSDTYPSAPDSDLSVNTSHHV